MTLSLQSLVVDTTADLYQRSIVAGDWSFLTDYRSCETLDATVVPILHIAMSDHCCLTQARL